MSTLSRARRGVAAGVGAVALLAGTGVAAASPGGTTLQRDVDAVRAAGVTGVLAETSTPGGTEEARAGVMDVRTGRPIPRGASFRGGSNTKTYVATVVLQLVGEGRMSLEDTVDRWLPSLVRGNGNDGRKITVRNLLQHTSGLYNYTHDLPFETREDLDAHRFDHYTSERLVGLALRHRPEFEPGETGPDGNPRWSYCNTGYVLAGMIVERVTGHRWDEEVMRRIVRPLGLTHTAFAHGVEFPGRHPRGYQQFEDGGPLLDATAMDYSWASSAGNLVTTAADHNRFLRALFGGRLLRPAEFAEMRRTVPDDLDGSLAGSRYGLGLMWFPLGCSKAGYWGHGGDTPGYMTRGGVTPDGRRAVTVNVSTQLDGDAGDREDLAAGVVVRDALCAR
ncbi:serine hydrolase [Actinomadura sp. NEAU-AAG7]|uniref:serine hydrolase domain-containing protein n=1 Tax=Actinomadura sp. NEAU-AAG7 TaxID=2839640 RepID=UPI001BE3DDDF|nr:serine hydrolase domain-containing protein [Actinomadura sp. NEAU-AAG7]MBT2214085.1 beta-lactamase family protein [Actinomadura sp. NEAU-AAG7]